MSDDQPDPLPEPSVMQELAMRALVAVLSDSSAPPAARVAASREVLAFVRGDQASGSEAKPVGAMTTAEIDAELAKRTQD